MTYATAQDLIDRYGQSNLIQLTDREATGSIDQTVLGRALSDADAIIDGYIATRFAVPMSPVPAALIPIACALAYFNLHSEGAPLAVANAKTDALVFLRDVASGKAALGTGGPAASDQTGAGSVQFIQDRPGINPQDLDDYR